MGFKQLSIIELKDPVIEASINFQDYEIQVIFVCSLKTPLANQTKNYYNFSRGSNFCYFGGQTHIEN